MKKILLTLTLAVATATTFAQEVYSSSGKPLDEKKWGDDEEESGFNPNKMIYGGGFVFGIGGGVTNLGASPIIGYKITEKFSAGIGLGYNYLSIKDYRFYNNPNTGAIQSYTLRNSIYSGSIWARHMIFQNIFAHVEPELLLWNRVDSIYYDVPANKLESIKKNVLVPRLLVGGGLRQPISDRVSFVGLILYDIIQDPNSPYTGLDIRFGIAAGF